MSTRFIYSVSIQIFLFIESCIILCLKAKRSTYYSHPVIVQAKESNISNISKCRYHLKCVHGVYQSIFIKLQDKKLMQFITY
jgi:hypothetical protein